MIELKRLIIALMQLKGVGRQKIKILLEMINQPLDLSFKEVVEFGQTFHIISPDIDFDTLNKTIDYADQVIQSSANHGINCVSYLDENFPDCLNFPDYPVLLFYQGCLEILNHPQRAAVIGSRTPTQQGADFSFQAGRMLAEEHFVVISGLATGCDYYGHLGCLSAGGKTVAFLPSGLLKIYPPENMNLAERIILNDGCLLSEYSHWESIQPYKFIERDRLQSGSSQFVIVSNFSPKSGTNHTLNFAQKYGRKIFSSPVIFDESKNGFEELDKRKISFEIHDDIELRNLIKNFN